MSVEVYHPKEWVQLHGPSPDVPLGAYINSLESATRCQLATLVDSGMHAAQCRNEETPKKGSRCASCASD